MILGNIRLTVFCVCLMIFIGSNSVACESYSSAIRDQVEDIEELYTVEIEKVEKESYKRILGARSRSGGEKIPHAPFGFRQNEWIDFKKKIEPGDCLMYFNTNSESWDKLRGRSGYLIVRSGEIIEVFIAQLN